MFLLRIGVTDGAVARGGQSESLAADKRLISGAAARAAMNNTTRPLGERSEVSKLVGERAPRPRCNTIAMPKSGELRRPGYEIRLLIDETDLFAAESRRD